MIRIVLADQYELMREGLKALYEKSPGMQVVDETPSAPETFAYARAKSSNCDVLVLDPEMPGRSGIEMITKIKAISPQLPVLVLTARDEQGFACRTIRAGASGFLTKAGPFSELLTATRRLAAGRPYISVGVAEQLALELIAPNSPNVHERLTSREQQIFNLLLRGNSLTKIGQELNLSVKTVSTHKARIMEKMNLSSFAEMMQYAMAHRLIPSFTRS